MGEVASVHRLGVGTAAAFKLEYATRDAEGKFVKRPPFQSCFSLTCRALGAALCAHADRRGLVLPPRVAAVQVVILRWNETVEADHWSELVASELQKAAAGGENWVDEPLRVQIDRRPDMNFSKKLHLWARRGVPIVLTQTYVRPAKCHELPSP